MLVFKLSPLNASQELLWTGAMIDPEVILQFSSLNENDIIQTLRSKYPVKVIIVENKQKSPNPNLTIGNIPEDEALVQFLKKNPQYNGEDFGGHLEPYERLYGETQERPSIDKHIIFLGNNASRGMIIHEFMHCYLDLVRQESPIEREHVLYAKKSADFFELVDKNQAIQLLKESYQYTAKNVLQEGLTKLFKLERDIVVAGGQFLLKGNAYYSQGYGEEIDVYRFMYEHHQDLELTEQETKENLVRTQGYVSLILEKMEKDLGLQEWMFRFQTSGLKDDQEVQTLYRKDLVDLLTQIQDKIDQTTEWYKAHNHEG